jgi:ADP-heptose:LPS heptosyltransferase
MWPAENFAALAKHLTAASGILPQAKIIIFGAPNEAAQAQMVIDQLQEASVINLVGKLDLLACFAVLQQCALYIGNDSGLMHLAAASGIPTVGLFGPSPSRNYAPYGPDANRGLAIQTPESYEDLVYSPTFDHRKSESLMKNLTVEKAEQQINTFWAGLQRKAA